MGTVGEKSRMKVQMMRPSRDENNISRGGV